MVIIIKDYSSLSAVCLVCWGKKKKKAFLSRKNTAVTALSFCLAFCVCDVINKVVMYGRSVYYVESRLSSAVHW